MSTWGLDKHFKGCRCYLIEVLDLDLNLVSGMSKALGAFEMECVYSACDDVYREGILRFKWLDVHQNSCWDLTPNATVLEKCCGLIRLGTGLMEGGMFADIFLLSLPCEDTKFCPFIRGWHHPSHRTCQQLDHRLFSLKNYEK